MILVIHVKGIASRSAVAGLVVLVLAFALKDKFHTGEKMLKSVLQLATLIGILIASSVSSAASDGSTCYLSEIDPSTKRIYLNKAQWDADLTALWGSSPSSPNPFRLLRGYEVSITESKNSKGIGSDKRKHCYVGCRISEDVGHDVAIYAAIYKEDRDLTDCKIKTHFDPADIEATIVGADLAKKNVGRSDAGFCRTECRQLIRR